VSGISEEIGHDRLKFEIPQRQMIMVDKLIYNLGLKPKSKPDGGK